MGTLLAGSPALDGLWRERLTPFQTRAVVAGNERVLHLSGSPITPQVVVKQALGPPGALFYGLHQFAPFFRHKSGFAFSRDDRLDECIVFNAPLPLFLGELFIRLQQEVILAIRQPAALARPPYRR